MATFAFTAVIVLVTFAGAALADSLTSREVEAAFERPVLQFTDRPIIGVLTLPITVPSQRKFGKSSIATSYVRWIEAGGARVAPIFFDSTPEELDYILNRVNGILWTGGLVDFNPEVTDPEGSLYLNNTKAMLAHVIKENQSGNFYPLWGTCLGFERMAQLLAEDPTGETVIENVDAENFGINLGFTTNGWLSRLFGGMQYQLFKEVASPLGNLAFNNHGLGIHPEKLEHSPADKVLKILSVDEDRNGKAFVSTVEGRTIPLYGTQWHPEKSPWEWTPNYHMSHSGIAVEFSNYVGRFFVNECKYNKNKFNSTLEESRALVNNWNSVPTGEGHDIKSGYSEIIFFSSHDPWNQSKNRTGAPNGLKVEMY